MYEVICADGRPVYVTMQPDAYFEEYGYYYEVFADENGDRLIDWGNTYDAKESYESALDWLVGVLEISAYNFI
jgi:hypothetical protein